MATLRDLICFEGQRCKHGHPIDVRLSHQDLPELVGAARPVISTKLIRMKREGLVEYTRCYFCVDDLAGLSAHRRRMKLLELPVRSSRRRFFGGIPASFPS